ncbi:Uncharacterised protein [Bordetella pertussis]|nr:Uncharacterised protein [Bordetella pertussis]CFV94207.1 Uncharacterised protein [Bordetella pertussis]
MQQGPGGVQLQSRRGRVLLQGMLVQPQLLGRGAQGQQITGFQRIARDQQAEHFQRVGIAPLFVGAMTDRVQRLLLRLVQPLQAPHRSACVENMAQRLMRS